MIANRIHKAWVAGGYFTVQLENGYRIGMPFTPLLYDATPAQRRNFEVWGNGQWVRWEEIDEDISLEGMLRHVGALERSTPPVVIQRPTVNADAMAAQRFTRFVPRGQP